ncbi:hypothetical protein G9A89_012984 [Geosiphon pyriformis]|nr:hypothetical protein G9A89_012984 [Geosiphon pyriformis]
MSSLTKPELPRMASATSFIALLKSLKYPHASELLPEQISWATENSETRVIFDWLCENIDLENNVVNKEILTLSTISGLETQLENLRGVLEDLDESYKEKDRYFEQDSIKLDLNMTDTANAVKDVVTERKIQNGKERRLIEATIEHQRLSTFLLALVNEINQVDSYIPDKEVLRSKFQQNSVIISSVNEQIKDSLVKIEALLKSLAETHIENPILIAENISKSNCQTSIIRCLDVVIDLSLSQYAHNQFIAQACQIEYENQKTVDELLIKIKNELQVKKDDSEKRIALFSAKCLNNPETTSVVSSHDHLLLSMKNLMFLDGTNEKFSNDPSEGSYSFFTSYQSLKEKISQIQECKGNVSHNLEEELKELQEFVEICSRFEQTMIETLYSNSLTSELLLTPISLSDLQLTLRAKTNRLQPKLSQIAKELMATDQIRKRKELFHLFHTDPEQFQNRFFGNLS